MRSAKHTTLCKALQSWFEKLPYHTEMVSLHRGPTDHKRSVGPLLSLPEVHNQLFSFAHIQRERQLSWHHDVSLSTSSKYTVGNEA